MSFIGRAKKIKSAVTSVLAAVLLCVIGSALTACSPQDIKYDDAIAIAKKDFGCEKILWIDSGAEILSTGVPTENTSPAHYSFYVVGEKDGKEVYILIPSPPTVEKPHVSEWKFDYTFTQIVDKLNKCGARYVIQVPDDYYSAKRSSFAELLTGQKLNGIAGYYEVGCSDDEFYERLDVKAAFQYVWIADGNINSCIITQESGQLKSYTHVRPAD